MGVYSLILLLITVVNLFLALFAVRRERNKMTLTYSIFMICIVFYSFGYAFELTATNLHDIIFWLDIEYIGISFFSPIFLLFTLYFTRKDKIITAPLLFLIFGISFIIFFIHLTNFHNLFITKYDLVSIKGLVLSNFEKGIWYWIHQAYFNIIVLICAILFAQMMFKSHGTDQIRASIMLFNVFLSWLFYFLFIMGYGPKGIDVFAFSLSLIGIIGSIGLMRFDILNFTPIALSHVFESMEDAVFVFDRDNEIVRFNHAACKLLSSISNKEIEMNYVVDVHDYPELIAVLQRQSNDSSDIEIIVNGESRFFLATVSVIVRYIDDIQGKTLILVDITERKQIENLLVQSEAQLREMNKAKDKFYELIAHDLRNPFNSLLNLSRFLKKSIEVGDKEKALRLAEAFDISARNGYELLQNLLDWAKVQQGVYQYCPQRYLLKSLVQEEIRVAVDVAKSKRIDIQVSVPEDQFVFVDANMFRSILRNFITNAIKYSFENQSIQLTAVQTNAMVEISITDSGIGMTAAEIDILLIKNTLNSTLGTNNERGTGFGLRLCKEFISFHKGEFGVDSEKGKGSRFWFRIPVV